MKTLSLTLGAACALALLGLAALTEAQQVQQSAPNATAQNPSANDFSQAVKELNIMSNILAASMQEDGRANRYGPSPDPEGLYLAGQGMVFTFNVNNPWFRGGLGGYWQEFGQNMAQLAQDLTAELTGAFPNADFNFDPDYDQIPPVPPSPFNYDDDPAAAASASRDLLQAQRDTMREMAEEMRDSQRDIQARQRDLRELQRNVRAPGADAARVESRIAEVEAELEGEMKALERQREAYEDYAAEYEQRVQEQVEGLGRALAERAVDALCNYGATLRSLGPDEHVTLIFENYNQNRDQVHVFRSADIAACRSADDLMASAVSYQL